jgi:hypothetical protein
MLVCFGSRLNGPGLVSCQDTNPGPVARPLLSCISFAMSSVLEVRYMAGRLAGCFSKDYPWLGINPRDHANTVLCNTIGAPLFPTHSGVSGLALGIRFR